MEWWYRLETGHANDTKQYDHRPGTNSNDIESLFQIGIPPPQTNGRGLFGDDTNDVPPSSSSSSSIGFSKQSISSLSAVSQEDNGSIDHLDSGFSYKPVYTDNHFSVPFWDLHISEDISVPELVSTELLMHFGLSYASGFLYAIHVVRATDWDQFTLI